MLRGVVAGLLLLLSFSAEGQEVVKSGCSKNYPGVEWFIYDDGTTGKDPRAWKCGFRRYLNLSVKKEYGDRFYPAIVKVDYKDMRGRIEPWGMVHHSTTIGIAVRIDRDTVEIYGDGRTGDGIFRLGREEIQFRIEEEPVCERLSGIDCQGYEQRSRQEFIYYGEEDKTVVIWELGILAYSSHSKHGDDVPIGILKEYDEDSNQWRYWSRLVEEYNKIYANSGVHIQYKLKKAYTAHWHSLQNLWNMATKLPVDIVLGKNLSYINTCGVADVTIIFKENQPPVSMSRCDKYTDLHELGHSVGLAHGPENQSFKSTGYIFPEFGHGWNNICGKYDDLMSYGYEGVFHSNSLQACFESTLSNETLDAGSRQWSDTAYSLNRVRYNVALIHDEYKYLDKSSKLRPIQVQSKRIGIQVVD